MLFLTSDAPISFVSNGFLEAVRQNDRAAVKWCLDCGEDLEYTNELGETALKIAAACGYEAIVKDLVSHHADVHHADQYNYVPLYYAALNGHLGIVQYLAEHGSDIDHTDRNAMTPLLAATLQGHHAVVSYLVDQGVDLDHQNDDEVGALFLSIQHDRTHTTRLLVERGADVNLVNDGWTPLALAAHKGDLDTVRLLVQHDADMNFTDRYGQSPISLAAQQRHQLVVLFLLDEYIAQNQAVLDNTHTHAHTHADIHAQTRTIEEMESCAMASSAIGISVGSCDWVGSQCDDVENTCEY